MKTTLKSALAIATLVTVALSLKACGSDTTLVTRIGAAGGSVSIDGGLMLTIPAGALDHEASITVEQVSDGFDPSLGPVYKLGPEGLTFNSPVTLLLPFWPDQLPVGNSSVEVVIATKPTADATDFEELTTQLVDVTHVSATTTHFSLFGATLGKKARVDAGVPPDAGHVRRDAGAADLDASSIPPDAEVVIPPDAATTIPPDAATVIPPDAATAIPPDAATIPPDAATVPPDAATVPPDAATMPPDADTISPDASTPTCTPLTCTAQGISCGPAGDGCGGQLDCTTCTAPMVCGGGGVWGVCGAPTCTPKTCNAQNIHCGSAGDTCGNVLSCGVCSTGTCGGAGVPSTCGVGTCTPQTCSGRGLDCGPAADGCGGLLQCGSTCPAGLFCGGGGTPNVCGSACTPQTCATQAIWCGPAGDGCGGLLQCGNCTTGTCGGGGPGVCG